MVCPSSVVNTSDKTGSTVLVVEDSVLVAEAVADGLGVLGYPNVEKANSVDQALDFVERAPIVMALVETSVRKHSTEPVIEALDAKEIPYVIITTEIRPTIGSPKVPHLYKPFGFSMLKDAVKQARDQAAVQEWTSTD